MSTDLFNKWLSDVLGVDPARYAAPSAMTVVSEETNQSVETDEGWLNQSVDSSMEPAPEAPAVAKKKKGGLKGAVDLKKKLHEFKGPLVPVLGACFTAQFVWVIEVKGKVETIVPEGDESTEITAFSYDDGAVSQKVARSWSDEEGVRILGLDTAFTEIEFEGAVKVEDGIEVGVSATGKLACGVGFGIEATLVKVDEESHVEGPELSCVIELPFYAFAVPNVDLGAQLRLSDVQVRPVVTVKLEPNWARIWARVAARFGKDAALRAAAEKGLESGVGAVGVDVAIASGFLAIAAASIAASVGAIGELGDSRKAAEQANLLVRDILTSYKAGLLAEGAPGLKVLLPGFSEGVKARDEATAKLQANDPVISEEEVTLVLQTVADRVVAQARPELETMVRTTLWENFASTHRDGGWGGSRKQARWVAWNGIFGKEPRGEELYTRYEG